MADAAQGERRESPGQAAYRWVLETPRKMTTRDLEGRIIGHFGGSRAEARRVIRGLVAQGRLAYISLYGQSYVDLGLRCPTPLTGRLVLYPPECTEAPAADEVGIVLEPGAAFGDGRHPTTRLAVEGLESICFPPGGGRQPSLRRGIDIGTGSGILAITAARFGIPHLDALDIDPCALNEARRNIAHNRLAHRITLSAQTIESLTVEYDLLMANLRLPTLCALAAWANHHIRPDGYLVFSGFRAQEKAALQMAYPKSNYRLLWSKTMAGWGGVVFQKA